MAKRRGDDSSQTLIGTSAADVLFGLGGNDRLHGFAGRDALYGGTGNDRIAGGAGNDRLYGHNGADTLLGERDHDMLRGGAGNDRLFGQHGNDQLFGEAHNDILRGGDGNDRLYGQNGNDQLYGDAHNDILKGGNGNDRLYGQHGNDQLYGDAHNDILRGGNGNDRLYGQHGNDQLYGDAHNDILRGGDGDDRLYGQNGNDQLFGDAHDDILRGGNGNDRLYGQNGNDRLFGDAHDDILRGGNGNDRLYGQNGNDQLYGDAHNDILQGGDGNDRLFGDAGDDYLAGGDGDDYLDGGAGNDYLDGGGGLADALYGGDGDDTLIIRNGATVFADGGAGLDTLLLGHLGPEITLHPTPIAPGFSAGGVLEMSGGVEVTSQLAGAATVSLGFAFPTPEDETSAGDLTVGIIGQDEQEDVAPVVIVEEPPLENIAAVPGGDIVIRPAPTAVEATLWSIETIDLSGGGLNRLQLSDVDAFLLPRDNYLLTITGDVGDRVDAGTGWVHAPGTFAELSSGTVYRKGGAYLEIADGLVFENAPPPADGTVIVPGDFGNGAAQIDLALEDPLITRISGDFPELFYGFNSLAVGNFDGDGRADIVWSNGYSYGADGIAQALVLPGAVLVPGTRVLAGELLDTAGHTIEYDGGIGLFGLTLAVIGDENGDGYDDFLVSGKPDFPPASPPPETTAVAHDTLLVRGSADLDDIVTLAGDADGTNGVRIAGPTLDLYDYSTVLTGIGDVNADGYEDFAVSSQFAELGNEYPYGGQTVVVYGGLDSADVTLGAGTLPGYTLSGAYPGEQIGTALAAAGDFDGDGYDDFLVGVAGYPVSYFDPDPGAAFLIYGQPQGADRELDPASFVDSHITVFHGRDDLDRTGAAVAGIGDFDGDGYDDLAISAPAADPYGEASNDTGEVTIVYGRATRTAWTEDLDDLGDGGLRIRGVSSGDLFGASVTSAGDFNGDGYDDLLITAPGTSSGAAPNDAGSAYIVFGGNRISGARSIDGFGENEAVQIYSSDTALLLGFANIVGGEDVNGDGYDDIVIAAPYGGLAQGLVGQLHVIFGRGDISGIDDTPVPVVDFEGTEIDDNFVGTAADEILIGGLGDDILDGAGGNDVIIGAAGDDRIIYDAADTRRVDGGTGTDTLVVHGRNLHLPSVLASTGTLALEQIEMIDLADGGANALVIDFDTLLRLTDSAHRLRVVGDTGDFVVFDETAFGPPTAVEFDGVDYVRYAAGAAELLVETGIAAGLPPLTLLDDGATPAFDLNEDTEIYITPSVLDNDHLLGDPALLQLRATGLDTSIGTPAYLSIDEAGQIRVQINPDGSAHALTEGETQVFDIPYFVTDGWGRTAQATVALRFVGVNDAPVVEFFDSVDPIAASFTEFGRPARISNDRFGDVDGRIEEFTIRIVGDYSPGLDLLVAPEVAGIASDFDGQNGVLTVQIDPTISDSVARDFLRNVVYTHTSPSSDLGDKALQITATDDLGAATTATGAIVFDAFDGHETLTSLLEAKGGDGSAGYYFDLTIRHEISAGADFDGDGFADFIVLEGDSERDVAIIGGGLVSVANAGDLHAAIDYDSSFAPGYNPYTTGAALGDVNGDGYDDFLVSAHYNDKVIFVHGGAPGSIAGLADIEAAGDAAQGGTLFTSPSGAYNDLGRFVRDVGDVNGDGYADFAVVEGLRSDNGTSHIVLGRPEGFGGVAVLTDATAVDYDASLGYTLTVSRPGYHGQTPGPGYEILRSGDFNGDGYDDIVVDARSALTHDASGLFFVFGGASANPQTDLNSSDFTPGADGFVIYDHEDPVDLRDGTFDTLGDFNGDGIDDFVVRVNTRSIGGDTWTTGAVVYGGQAFGALYDLESLLDGSRTDAGFAITHTTFQSTFDARVFGVGDVNGDGYADLAIGSPQYLIDGRDDAGRVSIVFGAPDRPGSVDIDSLGASDGVYLDGYARQQERGKVVVALGDVNGDGFDDIYLDSGTSGIHTSSEEFVVFGRDFADKVDFLGQDENDTLNGTGDDDILIGGRGNDTLDGGAGNDTLNAGAGDDTLIYDPADTAKVDGGSGVDTLLFTGADLVLDFDNARNIENIELIDMTGSGNNTVRFDIHDVLALPDRAALFDDAPTRQLRIDGDSGDTVESTGQGWQQGDAVDIGGVSYANYGHGDIGAQLLIDPDITVIIS
jgi:hypothetical protein